MARRKKIKGPLKAVIGGKEWTMELLSDMEQLSFLEEKADCCGRFGFDTESSGPLLRNGRTTKTKNRKYKDFVNMYLSSTTGYSLAFPDGTAYYVPLKHRKENAPYRQAVGTLSRLLVSDRRFGQTPSLGADGGRAAIVHNWQHEILALRDLGLDNGFMSTARDSMVAAWLAGAGIRKTDTWVYGLKELTARHLGYKQMEFKEVAGEASFDLLDPKDDATIRYACEDAITALMLHDKFEPTLKSWNIHDWYLDVEMPFVWICREMTDVGVSIDPDHLSALHDRLLPKIASVAARFEHLTGGARVSSSAQLQSLFGRFWPTDYTKNGHPRTKAGKWSTDRASLEKLYPHCSDLGKELIDLRLEFNGMDKIRSTYTTGLVETIEQYPDEKLHPNYKQVGTVTGRLSSSSPNAQNIPARSELGRDVLCGFVAPRGAVLGSADYSQIELRILAHFCGGKLAEAYQQGRDVHQQTADLVGSTRDQGKLVNFSIIYGAHHNKLAGQLKVSVEEAARFQHLYRKGYPAVMNKIREVIDWTYKRGYVRTLSGRRRLFPQLLDFDPSLARAGFASVRNKNLTSKQLFRLWAMEREAFNCVCQGSASDVMKKAMVDLWKSRDPREFRFMSQIHDDIRWEQVEGGQDQQGLVKRCLENAWPGLRVPLVAEPVLGKNWKDLK